ncbi:MAG: succinyldiaminopimelate transaminase [Gammaproteobacteria bacterium]
MNPDLELLHPYPFQKLAALREGVEPASDRSPIALSIGEPKHPTPELIQRALTDALAGLGQYPMTRCDRALRSAISAWIGRRFGACLDPEKAILPVNGTREAIFAIAQTVVERGPEARVMMPNPFYQIYEGAALLAGATPHYLNCTAENAFIPDLDAVESAEWDRCQLIYICSPGNPSGAVAGRDFYRSLIELADRHDFVIASDECYSELYPVGGEPPPGLLQVCAELGRNGFERCLAFHSLSKRSNAPGLRSGFVAGDARVIEQFHQYRTYHGCSMPPHHQAASIAAWSDETHVEDNRRAYQLKFDAVLDILGPVMDVQRPDAGFYLWPGTPQPDPEFARGLFAKENVAVLPGSYLSRPNEDGGADPGANRVRMALVAPLDECVEGAHRVRRYIETL